MSFDWYIEKVKKSDHYNGQPIVVHKGSLNPKFIWVGEAPCRKAATTGEPFSGPSGKLLDKWIAYLGSYEHSAIINVCPLVLTTKRGKKLVSPTPEMMKSFSGLCIELLNTLCYTQKNTTTIFLLGKSVQKALADVSEVRLNHPAYYIRCGMHTFIPPVLKKYKKEANKHGWW